MGTHDTIIMYGYLWSSDVQYTLKYANIENTGCFCLLKRLYILQASGDSLKLV